VPPIAVDPVRGGAKVTAQARACGWPAVVPAERLDGGRLDGWLSWCLEQGRRAARQRLASLAEAPDPADELPAALRAAEAGGAFPRPGGGAPGTGPRTFRLHRRFGSWFGS
jgi:hypothetical protein